MYAKGALYIACGQKHYHEAVRSLKSLKKYQPTLPVALITDQHEVDARFDIIIQANQSGLPFRDKIRLLRQTPFHQTLFIDTDTIICGDLQDYFTLLDRFDIGVAIDYKRAHVELKPVPLSFPEMNTGVLVYKKSTILNQFLEDWLQCFDNGLAQNTWEYPDDQAAFRQTLYQSPLRLTILPHQYHVRYLSAGILTGKAYILHGRPNQQYIDIERVAHLMNKNESLRVYVAGEITTFKYGGKLFAGRMAHYIGRFTYPIWWVTWLHIRESLSKRGVIGTLKFIIERFRHYAHKK